MNEIRPRDRYAEDLARAREIVARHKLPDFITGFDVRLGTSEGRPALYVLFKTTTDDETSADEVLRRSAEYGRLDHEVLPELFDAFEDRLPISFLVPEHWEGTISH